MKNNIAVFFLIISAIAVFNSCQANISSPEKNKGQGGIFSININSSMENGSITVQDSVDEAKSGSEVTLHITAAEGYAVQSITVLPSDGDIIFPVIKGNTASFTMPQSNVTIVAVFKESVSVVKPSDPPLIPEGYYSIVINSSIAHGSVIVQGGLTVAKRGDFITLSVVPDARCVLKSFSLVYTNAEGIEKKWGVSGTGTTRVFNMPEGNVIIYAEFEVLALYAVLLQQPILNGEAVIDEYVANAKDTVTVFLTPNEGYSTNNVTVKTAGGQSVDITRQEANVRSFIMPDDDVFVTVTFILGEDPEIQYFDNNFDASLCSFYDKFEGTALNTSKWSALNDNSGGGNSEAQYYDPANVTVSDGMLHLTAKKQSSKGKAYTSGKMVTSGNNTTHKFSQTYGRFEAKIRMSKAALGMWPAFWMMPKDGSYGGWPRSGEIDIMEMKGRLPNRASSTVHWVNASGGHYYLGSEQTFMNGNDFTQWHVYGIIWSSEEFIMLIDGYEFRRLKRTDWHNSWYNGRGTASSPFDRDFYFILNLAVGGTFDGVTNLPPDSALPISLDFDWVRVYTLEKDPWHIFGKVPSNLVTNHNN
ncbi:MAG: family 16 glycosylhydrolase [Treponema sp.]|nr:family 16 glycosylhydrolase [Treponema sp.]